MSWQPSATLEILKKRADLLQGIRHFFEERGVLEVETPLLSHAGVTDPYIDNMQLELGSKILYLQTSPEFAMKRLLASGSGSIFQLCKSFRVDELGRFHNPEFSMLEWYRVGFDHHALMDEVDALFETLLKTQAAKRYTYQALFQKYLKLDPLSAAQDELMQVARQHHIDAPDGLDKDDWLNILLTHLIEPKLQALTFIYNYPKSQAALAKVQGDVAERFEVYMGGVELANGYHELSDGKEQAKRFQQDLAKRTSLGKTQTSIDNNLIAALEHGLPECAGIALGVDRLLMLAAGVSDIAKVLAFPVDRA